MMIIFCCFEFLEYLILEIYFILVCCMCYLYFEMLKFEMLVLTTMEFKN